MFGLKKKIDVDAKIRKAVLDLRAAISTAKATLDDLAGQLDSSTKELKLVDVKLELSERERDEVMDKFVAHKIDEAQRDASVQAVNALRMRRETVSGVVTACEKGLRETQAQIGKLALDLESAEFVFWQNLFALLKEQLREEFGAAFLRANTALVYSRSPGVPFSWNERVFDYEYGSLWPTQDEMTKHRAELEKEFLKD